MVSRKPELIANKQSYSIWIYPWDLKDEGIDKVCFYLQDLGYTSLSLATSYHAGKILLPHNPKKKVYFLEDGTVYFHPEKKLYGRLKPLKNSLLNNSDILKTICKSAQKHKLLVNAWTVCLHNSRLGFLYPDCCIQNAFGDYYYTSLCPSNPHSKKYVIGLCNNLAYNYPIQSIELESFDYMGYEHGYHHEKNLVHLPEYISLLMSLCFCKSCQRQANKLQIPFSKIQNTLKAQLKDYFQTGKFKDVVNKSLQWQVNFQYFFDS